MSDQKKSRLASNDTRTGRDRYILTKANTGTLDAGLILSENEIEITEQAGR